MTKRQMDYYVTTEAGIQTIWIKNHGMSKPLFKSNDKHIVKQRIREMEQDCANAKFRHEAILAMYRFARDHGCVKLMTPEPCPTKGILKIRREVGDTWVLIIARGLQEMIFQRGSKHEMREGYFQLNRKFITNPSLIVTMWDDAMSKQVLEVVTREEESIEVI